jgi:hypothetical protein
VNYYIVATTKFAEQCIEHFTYGATQSNWLANVDIGDIVFLSQFNYKAQEIFGPLRVVKTLFYNKSIIYPAQKYFYRVQFAPVDSICAIEETDLYLNGIQRGDPGFYYRLINLIQQNKHLHCISLTDREGMAILDTLQKFGIKHKIHDPKKLDLEIVEVTREYVWQKNRLDKKRQFASESDFETYLLLSLKNKDSSEYKTINEIMAKYSGNNLVHSAIYNQFIFGNAYPADLVVVTDGSINVFELKRDRLSSLIVSQIEKEMRKHLYYSLLSERVAQKIVPRVFNFYLVCLYQGNKKTQDLVLNVYESLQSRMQYPRKNNLMFLEYEPRDDTLFLFQA